MVPLPAALGRPALPGRAARLRHEHLPPRRDRAGQTVAIVGIGFLGAHPDAARDRCRGAGDRDLAPALLAGRGAASGSGRDDRHGRPLARSSSAVKELTGGAFCERVIEAVGKQWPLDLAAELTAERGRLVIAGYHQDGPRQVNMQLWNWRGLDVINAHERDPARLRRRACARRWRRWRRGRLDPTPALHPPLSAGRSSTRRWRPRATGRTAS